MVMFIGREGLAQDHAEAGWSHDTCEISTEGQQFLDTNLTLFSY